MAQFGPWHAGYTSLMICRMVVGLGEASFVSLASPLIGMQCTYNVGCYSMMCWHLQGCLQDFAARMQSPARIYHRKHTVGVLAQDREEV